MTVKELIEDLQKLDQSKEIVFGASIESGRSLSWIEVDDYDISPPDEEDYYVFTISGDEDDGGYQ